MRCAKSNWDYGWHSDLWSKTGIGLRQKTDDFLLFLGSKELLAIGVPKPGAGYEAQGRRKAKALEKWAYLVRSAKAVHCDGKNNDAADDDFLNVIRPSDLLATVA